MLGKLLKYDFRSMLKSFLPLWPAFLVVAVINHFTFGASMEAYSSNALGTITMLVYFALMMAINIIGIVLIIQRFYNGLLKDEGYLMFTLPVKPWQLIASKGISAGVIIFVNAVLSVLSVMILIPNVDIFSELGRLLSMAGLRGFNVGLIVFLGFILLLAAILQSIFQVYAAMALGHLAPKHRVGFSVGAYIGIYVVLSTLSSIITAIVEKINPRWISDWVQGLSDNGATVAGLILLIVICLVMLAAFYAITQYILSKRLNLE